uniref:Uncharacterized protein n=1 Tax=Caulobacter sp. (strain K31) TaxID=366602 RepID=B0T653_CAUSK
MTNPTLNVTRFARANKTARAQDTYSAPLYGDRNMVEGLEGILQLQREQVGQPCLWSFGRYSSNHSKDSFIGADAITLEWDIRSEQELRDALSKIGWAHLIVDTENKTCNSIAVVFPLEEPITDPVLYTRAASLLVAILDVYLLQDGCWTITYLTQARPLAKIEFENGLVLNAANFAAKHRTWFVKAADYMVGKKRAQTAIPDGIQKLMQRAAATKAQLGEPTGLDLWEGL